MWNIRTNGSIAKKGFQSFLGRFPYGFHVVVAIYEGKTGAELIGTDRVAGGETQGREDTTWAGVSLSITETLLL